MLLVMNFAKEALMIKRVCGKLLFGFSSKTGEQTQNVNNNCAL